MPENKVVGSVQLVMGGKAEKGREGEVKETGLFHMTVTLSHAARPHPYTIEEITIYLWCDTFHWYRGNVSLLYTEGAQ